MGLFNFLKKEKPEEQLGNNLPPPAIPAAPSMNENKNAIPEPPMNDEPLFPEMPKESEKEVPPAMPEVEEEIPDKIPELDELPEAPKFPGAEINEASKKPDAKEYVPRPTRSYEEIFEKPKREEVVMSHKIKGPLFVKIEDYKETITSMEHMKNCVKNTDNNFVKLNDYRSEQDKHFEHLHEELENIQRKLVYADKILFER